MTLRSKLLVAQGPVALLLAVVAFVSIRTLTDLGRSPELILKDNYRSVLAAERMSRLLDTLQETALATSLARSPPRSPAPSTLTSTQRFEVELWGQEHNITEPGERAATEELRLAWGDFRRAIEVLSNAAPSERLARYFDTVQPAHTRARAATAQVLILNQDAMARKSERAHRAADRNVTAVVVAVLVALLLGLFASLSLTARLLRPLSVLSQTVRRIGEGDLEARAQVDGQDEIAALAREFNTMADGLAQYRRSSLGELLQAQQASQAAIDSLPDPVMVLDPEGAVLNLNGAAEALLRLGPVASPTVGALPPELRAVVERVRLHVLAGHGAYTPRGFEEAVRFEAPDGTRHLLPRATPLYSGQGSVAGATIVLQDVTRLMRFDELKNDLVATVAHEFRTPLTSLRMAIHLCAEEVVGPLTEKQADLMAAARQDCDRLQGIVDDLLDLSRIQSGRMTLRLERLDAGALLRGTTEATRPAANEAGIALTVTCPEGPLAVEADTERVQLVLTNLLANAVRHTPRGGDIHAAVSADDGLVRFEVRDSGEGIAREHQERIFERFYRVPGARSGAVGLGLFISREIVHAHGGTMGVESALGAGSTFWFTLPAFTDSAASDTPRPA